jgi:hypothetical protein
MQRDIITGPSLSLYSIWTVTVAVSHVAVPLVQQAFEIETKYVTRTGRGVLSNFCDSYETSERIYDLTHTVDDCVLLPISAPLKIQGFGFPSFRFKSNPNLCWSL